MSAKSGRGLIKGMIQGRRANADSYEAEAREYRAQADSFDARATEDRRVADELEALLPPEEEVVE